MNDNNKEILQQAKKQAAKKEAKADLAKNMMPNSAKKEASKPTPKKPATAIRANRAPTPKASNKPVNKAPAAPKEPVEKTYGLLDLVELVKAMPSYKPEMLSTIPSITEKSIAEDEFFGLLDGELKRLSKHFLYGKGKAKLGKILDLKNNKNFMTRLNSMVNEGSRLFEMFEAVNRFEITEDDKLNAINAIDNLRYLARCVAEILGLDEVVAKLERLSAISIFNRLVDENKEVLFSLAKNGPQISSIAVSIYTFIYSHMEVGKNVKALVTDAEVIKSIENIGKAFEIDVVATFNESLAAISAEDFSTDSEDTNVSEDEEMLSVVDAILLLEMQQTHHSYPIAV